LRTLTTIIVIALLLIVGSYTSYQYIQTATQSMADHLTVVEQSIANQKWEGAFEELTTAQQRWTEINTWWSILLDHEEIDTIDLSIKRLEKFIDTKDMTLSLSEVSALKFLFEHISEAEQFSLNNIL